MTASRTQGVRRCGECVARRRAREGRDDRLPCEIDVDRVEHPRDWVRMCEPSIILHQIVVDVVVVLILWSLLSRHTPTVFICCKPLASHNAPPRTIATSALFRAPDVTGHTWHLLPRVTDDD
mmetsp:Transcript_23190/g.72631  ORF Transcript_23190/g.72631 Transcript_23190/m.72631 type:complete len:122 (+) Transcript_23190:162-527(+)